jgi:calcium-dependent protein kinase
MARASVLEAPTLQATPELAYIDLGYSRDIDAKYEWGKELGKGGNGVVREVTSKETGEVFACKAIGKHLTGADVSEKKRSGHIDSIRRELEVLRRLSGSLNVVKLIDVYEDEQNVYVVQELCKGGELWHRIGERHYSERTVSRVLQDTS